MEKSGVGRLGGKERDVKRSEKEAQEPDKDAGKVSGRETKRLKNEMEQVYWGAVWSKSGYTDIGESTAHKEF